MNTTQLTATALAIVITLSARAATIFSENFESYAPGSNLKGQGGWTEGRPTGTSVVTITNGTYLPSLVMNGRAATGSFQENYVEHPIPIDPTSTTTLRFRAYAVSATPRSHNQYVGMNAYAAATNGDGGVWSSFYRFNGESPRWEFTIGTNRAIVPGGYDRSVEMGIVMDGVAKEIYGTYDFGTGVSETPHFRVTDEQLARVSGVRIYVDHRSPASYTGMEIDNIRVDFRSSLSIRFSQVEVCWPSVSNQMYQVQYRSELTTNMWTDLGTPVLGTGATNCIYDAIAPGQPRRFYRHVELP